MFSPPTHLKPELAKLLWEECLLVSKIEIILKWLFSCYWTPKPGWLVILVPFPQNLRKICIVQLSLNTAKFD